MQTIAILSDQPILVLGLRTLIETIPGIRVDGVCASVQELWSRFSGRPPEILLIDVAPDFDSSLISDLNAAAPDCRIVLWVRTPTPQLAWELHKLPACGVIPSSLSPKSFLHAMERVCAGESLGQQCLEEPTSQVETFHLTPREGQLVSLLSQGLKNKDIANHLGITEGTVKVYLSKLFDKLGVQDRFELALIGLKHINRMALPAGSRKPQSGAPHPANVRRLDSLALDVNRPSAPRRGPAVLGAARSSMQRQRGATMIEATLVFLIFIAIFWLLFDTAHAIFVRATLQHAVRSGVRYAVTSRIANNPDTGLSMGHVDSIKYRVIRESMGLLNDDSHIQVAFNRIDPTTGIIEPVSGAGANEGGNLVIVSINDYQIRPFLPLLRSSAPITVNVRSGDRMEANPATGPPPLSGSAPPWSAP